MSRETATEDHHPGPPRLLQVGERIVDPAFVDADHGFDRDNLAPTIAGQPERDPDNYDAGDFAWSVATRPADSAATIEYAPAPYGDDDRYDHGLHNTAEFRPDVPGTYVLELAAPDAVHELTLEVFPAPPDAATRGREGNPGVAGVGAATDGVGTGADSRVCSPPRLALDGRYDPDDAAFVIESNAELPPDSDAHESDLEVAVLPHDAAALSREDVAVEGTTARVPAGALDDPTSLYAAPYDGVWLGATDEIVLDPDERTVELPNRPPAWLDDAVVYEIFTRSFAGAPGATDFSFLADRVEYLADLGVDVVWLTPVVPARSPGVEAPPGGPHGYDTGDYFDVAEDLGTLAAFEAFVDACHDRGIRVCFDLVVNHCGWTNPRFQDTVAELGPDPGGRSALPPVQAWDRDSAYFDWFDRRAGASARDAAPAQTSFFGVRLHPNLNYGNLALREHVMAAVEFWSDRVDAFRCDVAWGVPHSFWTEVRERVRANDAEFLLIDEAIPPTPAFGESEFDCHFDTVEYTHTTHAVARGERPPGDLLDAIANRRRDGFPRYARFINAIENHDEARCYHEAAADGRRDDPARAQRAAAAAAFTLPGVPLVYYGQERLISEHGTRRALPYGDDNERSEDLEDDPYKRAFVDWTDPPEDHLQFYRDLIDHYHGSTVLGPTADLVRVAHRTDVPEDVLVFGRDAGEQKRIVAINFGPEPATVDLRTAVDTTDRFTGRDVAVGTTETAVTVAVDRLVILDAPALPGPRA